jgi:SAM-dependent methyltransferase
MTTMSEATATAATETAFDAARGEAFGGRMAGLLNDGITALAVSVGHQAGLFEVLETLAPSTSVQVASAAGLDERYVREWLAVMTVARIVEYEASGKTYRLPPEHAASLTKAAGPGNLAATTQLIALLASVESDLVEAFRNGGGVGYERYSRFARFMRDDSAQLFDVALVDTIIPIVDGLPARLESGIRAADIGCGAGHLSNLLARAYPRSTFAGYDLLADAIALAKAEAADWRLTNVQFEARDISRWDAEAEFDLITAFDAIHDQAQPRKVLAAVHRALKPGGVFLMVDIAAATNLEDNLEHPFAPFGYGVSLFHCMTVSLAQGGEGLGTMWGREKALELLAEAGFSNVEVRQADEDFYNYYYVARA